MKWYSSLSQIILDDSHEKLVSLRSSLPEGILDFYTNILGCLLKCICATYKGRTQIFKDMLKLDGWETMFRTTNEKETYFRNAIRDYSDERKISYLELLVDLYRSSAEDEVLRKIFVINMKTEIQSLQHRKDDLIPESSNWILNNEAFVKFSSWEKQNRCRRLWIKGKAGMGKTMLLIGVVKKLEDELQTQQETRFDAPYLSYFFCQGTNGKLNTATAVVRGLIWMFIRQERSLMQYAMRLAGQSLDDDLNTFIDIKNILLAILKNPIMKKVYIIIDAIDECIDASRSGGIPGRAHLLDFICQVSRDFPNVKCLISSRDELDIEMKFARAEAKSWVSLQLELDRKVLAGPIRAYIDKKMSNLETRLFAEWEFEGEVTEEDREMIHTKLQNVTREMHRKADGTFLWVALIFLRIEDERTDLRELPRLVNETSGKLGEIYEKMKLQIQQNKDGNSGFCIKALSIATTANRPLRLAEIRILADFPRDVSPLKILKLCRFFRIAEDDDKQKTVYMIHESAKQWLEKQLKEGRLGAIESSDCLASAHASLARRCLQILNTSLRKNIWNLPDPGVEIGQIQSASQGYASKMSKSTIPGSDQTPEPRIVYSPDPTDDDLIPAAYAALNWFDHMLKGDSKDDGKNLAAMLNFMKHQFLYWLEALSLLRQVGDGAAIIARLNRYLKSKENSSQAPKILTEIMSVMKDANRFTLYYQGIIEIAPLQIYSAAIEFSPMQSKIKNLFQKERPNWITSSPTVEEHWSPCLQTLEAHKGSVCSITFSHDGKRLASGSHDKTVRIWVAETGTLQQTLQGHRDWISSVAFSHDGAQLATGSHDKSVRIWEAGTGALQQILMDHKDLVSSVAFSPDGSWLASGSHDGNVLIYKPRTGAIYRTIEASDSWVLSVAFSYDGARLAAGMHNGKIGIWDVETGTQCSLYDGHQSSVSWVAFSWDDQRLASSSHDTTLCVWNVKNSQLLQTLEGHKSPILCLAFSPRGERLAFGSTDSFVRIWNCETDETVATLKGHRNSTLCIGFSPDGKRLASGSQDKTIRVWDIETDTTQQTSDYHSNSVSALAFSQDGKLLSSGSSDSTIRIWDTETGVFCKVLEGHRSSVYSLVFSTDGKYLASGSHDQTIRIWDTDNWTLRNVFKGHKNSIFSISFSPDGRQLVSGSHDKTIRVWKTQTGALRHTLMGHSNSVTSVAFSSDGKFLISGSQDKTVRIWEAETGDLRQTLSCQSSITSVAFSHDRKRFAAGAHDETVTIWHAETGDFEVSYNIGTSPTQLAFTRDGSGFVTERGYNPFQPSSQSAEPLPRSLYSVLADKSWITWNGDKILWIPWEYRPVCLMVRDHKIAVGCASGRVFLLGFSSTILPRVAKKQTPR
jgi:WD40 repeat protein